MADLRDTARSIVRQTILDNGGELVKRKKARKSIPLKPPTPTAPDALERNLRLQARAVRRINGNIFKLEPDTPVEDGDLVGELAAMQRPKGEMWSRVFLEERLTLQDLLPYRIRACWRIVREMARLKGLIADDEGLEVLFGNSPDPWHEAAFYQTADKTRFARLNDDVARSLADISLLPPEVPEGMKVNGYNPDHDGKLSKYMSTTHFLSLYLQIGRGSLKEPEQGRYGLFGLDNAHMIRLAFPTKLQIIAWEELLVDETFRSLADQGQKGTEAFLRETYGLRPYEILSLVKLAKSAARMRLENDLEEDRAVMVFRLEDLIARARESLDLRVELGALKQMALVMGLGRTDPEDSLKDFIDVVSKVSKEQKPSEELMVLAESPRQVLE